MTEDRKIVAMLAQEFREARRTEESSNLILRLFKKCVVCGFESRHETR